MCGACGGPRFDWAAGLLGGAYARIVVARLLSTLHCADGARLAASAGPAGWMLGVGGRPARLLPGFDELIDAVATAVGQGDSVERLLLAAPAHRPLDFDRRAVPASRCGGDHPDDPQGVVDDDRTIHRILVAAIGARRTGRYASVRLRDDCGYWTLIAAGERPRVSHERVLLRPEEQALGWQR